MIQSMKRLNTVYATLPDAASNYNAILEIHSRGIERFFDDIR